MQNKIEVDYYSCSILDFISNARQYCRKENISGKIIFDIEDNKLLFSLGGTKVDELKLSNDVFLDSVNFNKGKKTLLINNYGVATNSGSIKLKDSNNKKHIITVCVGTAYVRIKE